MRKMINKKRVAVITILSVIALSVSACSSSSESSADTAITDDASSESGAKSSTAAVSDNEVLITGSGKNISSDGSGVEIEDNVLTITEAGTYRLTGSVNGGHIVVGATKNDPVTLILDDISITSYDYAVIYADKCESLTIVLEEGTTNELVDARELVNGQKTSDDPDSVIFSDKDLILTGTGTLMVNGNYQEGIRGKDNVTVESGTYIIDVQNDALKANDTLLIKDGNITINAGDDAIHSDNAVVIEDGEISIESCYEGIEGLSVDINGGTISLTASDDGINAAGGKDTSSDSFSFLDAFTPAEGAYIKITGGDIYINANGDGIDSNGDLSIEGGVIYIDGPTGNMDAIIDFNGTGIINGGTLIGVGSSGMLQAFSSDSEQPFVIKYYSGQEDAGTNVSLTDEDGNEIVSIEAEKAFNACIVSSDKLEDGRTYQIITDDEAEEVVIDGISNQSGQGGFGMRGGFGGFGGGGPRGGMPGNGQMPDDGQRPEDGQRPDRGQGRDGGQRPEDGSGPAGDGMPGNPPGMNGERPEGMPEGMSEDMINSIMDQMPNEIKERMQNMMQGTNESTEQEDGQ